ncbi:MAG: metallophosphoesterase [Candidatus Aenigmarchaeota archaeon]|nr:metallophosphoesterase [Candidatus Aenigmarchaeota archaeon]
MFVTGYPAMKLGRHLVVTDLHIGIAKELYEAGVAIPSQIKSFSERLNKLKDITKTTNLVILGDVKHSIGTGFLEAKEIPEFFELLKFRKVIITKGNHDGNIEKLAGKNVSVRKSFIVGDYLLTHGHRNIKTDKKRIVIGHNHPHVRFTDELGAVYIAPCWVRGKIDGKTLIIVPSFNELSGMMVVNDKRYERFNGPIAKKLNKNSAHAYLLDGTDIGRIGDLRD